MSMLLIDLDARERIAIAIGKARANVIPWEVLAPGIVGEDKPGIALKDRKPGYERPDSEHLLLGSYRVAISFEQQPAGLVRHLSVSVPTVGRVPNEAAMRLLCEEFGFAGFPPIFGRVWLEEFDPGHHAINVVQVEPKAP
jgi:hypothetical protein